MVNLAPGVPIPLPPQDNSNMQSFGKGMAMGLEKYIDKRMKQKERAEILKETLEEYSKKRTIDTLKEIYDNTLALSATAQPAETSRLDLPRMIPSQVPQFSPYQAPQAPAPYESQLPTLMRTPSTEDEALARQTGRAGSLFNRAYADQEALPTIIPGKDEEQVKQDILSEMATTQQFPAGLGSKYSIKKVDDNTRNVYTFNPSNGKYMDWQGNEVSEVPKGAIIRNRSSNRATVLYGGKTLSELNSMIDDVRSKVKLLAPNYPYYVPTENKEEVSVLFEELEGLEELRRNKTGNKVKTDNKARVGDTLTINGKKYRITKLDPTGGSDHDVAEIK